MELHHKLRRDPKWHPSACNICGELGHQAAQCTNGTINWRQIYGDEEFRLKPPVYHSEVVEWLRKKKVDILDLEKRAKEFAEMRSKAADNDVSANPMTKQAQGMAAEAGVKAEAPQENGAKAPSEAAAAPGAAPPAAAPPQLPPGWAEATDPQGRSYYWHTQTKKVTWAVPTPDTPIS